MRACSAALLALLVLNLRALNAQSRIWRPDERVLITSFNNVNALAFNGRTLFDVTDSGLLMYDPTARRWLEPSTAEDGFPMFARPVAAQYSRFDAGLWVRTADGSWYLWSGVSGRWDAQPFGRTPRVDSGSGGQDPQNDVGWRVLSGTAGMDAFGNRWQISTAVPADRPGVYFAGTNGGGLLLADARNLSREWLPYGTLTRGAGALLADGESLWIGGDGAGPRNGVTRASADLQQWTWYEWSNTRAPRREVTRMLSVDGAIIAASVDGVYLLGPGARSWSRIAERQGLVSNNVRALAVNANGIWAGTSHGVALIDTTTGSVRWSAMQDARIGGLAVLGNETWVASDRGLWRVVPRDSTFDVLAAAADANLPIFRGAVASVAAVGGSVYAIAAGKLYDAAGSPIGDVALNVIGRPFDLRVHADTLYVLGSAGVARWRVGTRDWSFLTAPSDLPTGPVYDVAIQGRYTWLATPAGALRVLWR